MKTLTAAIFLLSFSANAAGLRLTWTPNQEPDLDHYNAYRSTNSLVFHQANVVPLTSPTYVDKNLPLATTYTYTVTAVDTSGNESEMSFPVQGMTPISEFVGPPRPRRDRIAPTPPTGVKIETQRRRKRGRAPRRANRIVIQIIVKEGRR
jgi:hypothetical protein